MKIPNPKFFLVFVLFCVQITAQSLTVSGVVVDEQQQPVIFANVVVLDEGKSPIQGAITEDDGSFRIENLSEASYTLKISFVGYEDYESELFTLSQNKTFPTIILEESAQSLDEVTLIGRKPTITRKADRLVFNVENSIVSSGSTWEILQKTPSVIANQDDLLIRGQGATVYLNDRKVQLSTDELKNLLENLGGHVVKSVEVIMNPPARYDAEGGPILNIVTSKNVSTGYKGNVNIRNTYAIFPKYSAGTSHYFKNDKLNLFANYSYGKRKEFKDDNSTINFKDGSQDLLARWDVLFDRTTRSESHNANVILDYDINDKNSLSFSAIGSLTPDRTYSNNTLTDVNGFQGNTSFTIDSQSAFDIEENNVALDLEYNLDVGKGSLSSNIHYTQYNRDRTQDLVSQYRDQGNVLFQTVDFFTDAAQDIEIYTGQIDYETDIQGLQFEVGAKVSIIDSQSKIDFFNTEDEGDVLDNTQSDNFLYDENVYAGYLSLGREWEKWSFKTGLRAEQTESVGNSLVLDSQQELNYLEFFPTAYVQYAPSETHSFSIDYARRLTRPRYQDLNPFSYFLTENNFATGNPNLLPAFANAFNFNYTLKGEYLFDFYFRDNGENILILPLQDNDAFTLRSQSQNAVESYSYGFDFNHGRSFGKWLYTYTYVSLFHEEETFVALESNNAIVTNEVEGVYISLTNFLTFDKKRTFTGVLSFEYLSEFLFGSYKQEETIGLNLGLRKSLWNKRAILSVTVEDILGEVNAQLTSRYLNQDYTTFIQPETQFVRIGFTYNFGNFRLEDNNRSLDKTERERLQVKD